MDFVKSRTKEEGLEMVTLTTYRDLKWNGSWYTKMGYVEIGGSHIQLLQKEKRMDMI